MYRSANFCLCLIKLSSCCIVIRKCTVLENWRRVLQEEIVITTRTLSIDLFLLTLFSYTCNKEVK